MIDWHDIPGWFSDEDARVYRLIVEQLPCNQHSIVVEIGCWMGRSMGALIEQCRAQKKQPFIYAIDTFKGSLNEPEHLKIAAEHGGSVLNVFAENIRRLAYSPLFTLVATSKRAGELIQREMVNAVFIDANHSYRSVRTDIATWLPKLKYDGVMAGHDYGRDSVKRAVDKSFSEIQTIGSCWLATK